MDHSSRSRLRATILVVLWIGGFVCLASLPITKELGWWGRNSKPSPVGWREWLRASTGDHSIVISGSEVTVIPSECELHVMVRDREGKVTQSEPFQGGWRIAVEGGAVSARTEAGRGLLELHSFPMINGRDVHRQYYRVFRGRLFLLRLEDPQGGYLSNRFEATNHTIGPSPPAWPPEVWEEMVLSEDPGEVLAALMLLNGHPDLKEARSRNRVKDRFRDLKNSPHPWIAEAARF